MYKMFSTIYNQTIHSNLDYIYHNSLKHNCFWEDDIVMLIYDIIKPNTDMLDIGANIGLITLAVNLLTEKTHNFHCVEMNNNIFNMLVKNTQIHKNIFCYNFGAGANLKIENMEFNEFNNGASRINSNVVNNNIFYPILPLDSIIDHFCNPISVIKIDVEGYEYETILGMKFLLEKHKPSIVIEIFPHQFSKVNELLITGSNISHSG